jgi:hypothetical protein
VKAVEIDHQLNLLCNDSGILTTQRRTNRPDPEWEADADRHLTPEGIAEVSVSNIFAV